MQRVTKAIVIGAWCLAPVALSAQTDSSGHIEQGTRVSVVLRNGGVFYPATVLRSTGDRLEFSARCHGCTSNMVVPLSDVARIKVLVGRSHGGKAALVGAGIGLLAGTVAATIAIAGSPRCTEACGVDFLYFPILGAAGLIGGSVTGLIVGTRRWRQIWPVGR